MTRYVLHVPGARVAPFAALALVMSLEVVALLVLAAPRVDGRVALDAWNALRRARCPEARDLIEPREPTLDALVESTWRYVREVDEELRCESRLHGGGGTFVIQPVRAYFTGIEGYLDGRPSGPRQLRIQIGLHDFGWPPGRAWPLTERIATTIVRAARRSGLVDCATYPSIQFVSPFGLTVSSHGRVRGVPMSGVLGWTP